jgi:hypothetical protein
MAINGCMVWHGNGMALLYTANILAGPGWHGPPGGQGMAVSKDLLDTREQKANSTDAFVFFFKSVCLGPFVNVSCKGCISILCY